MKATKKGGEGVEAATRVSLYVAGKRWRRMEAKEEK